VTNCGMGIELGIQDLAGLEIKYAGRGGSGENSQARAGLYLSA